MSRQLSLHVVRLRTQRRVVPFMQSRALKSCRCPCAFLNPALTADSLNDYAAQDGKALIAMSGIKVLVLDEADRMCDMGFEADIKKVRQEQPRMQ